MRLLYTSIMDAARLVCPKSQAENKAEGGKGSHSWVARGRQKPGVGKMIRVVWFMTLVENRAPQSSFRPCF